MVEGSFNPREWGIVLEETDANRSGERRSWIFTWVIISIGDVTAAKGVTVVLERDLQGVERGSRCLANTAR